MYNKENEKNKNGFEHAQEDWYKGKMNPESKPVNEEFGQEMSTDRTKSPEAKRATDRNQINKEQINFEFGKDTTFNTDRNQNNKNHNDNNVNKSSNVSQQGQYQQAQMGYEFGSDNFVNARTQKNNQVTNNHSTGAANTTQPGSIADAERQLSSNNNESKLEFGQDYFPNSGVNSDKNKRNSKDNKKNNK
jgi:hypothetical protein